jgi:predicted dehydrogenase
MGQLVRFGLLGCGGFGRVHAEVISSLAGEAALTAVADAAPARASAFAADFGCAASSDLRALCAREDVDAIVVCIPPGLHAGAATQAVTAGKDVIVDKPLDISIEAADRLIAAEARTGRIVSVMSQRRFEPAAQWARQAVESGALGTVTFASAITTQWRPQSYYDSAGWRGTRAVDGGGAALTLGVHALDLLLWLVGEEPVRVQAEAACLVHERIEVEDTLAATIRFATGAVGSFTATTGAYPGRPPRVCVYGDQGSIELGDDTVEFAKSTAAQAGDRFAAGVVPDRAGPGGLAAHRAQYQDFITAVRERRRPAVTTSDGRLALATIAAMYESARSGRAVEVSRARSRGPLTAGRPDASTTSSKGIGT